MIAAICTFGQMMGRRWPGRSPNRSARRVRYTASLMLIASLLVVGLAGCGGFTTYGSGSSSQNSSVTLTSSASSLSFGQQRVGTASAPQTVTITNTGSATANLTSVSCSGSSFAYAGTAMPTSLAASMTFPVPIVFNPTAPGSVSAQCTLASNASNSPLYLTLTGTGTAPIIGVSPSSISFGNQTIGATSASQNLTVSNTGQIALSVSQVTTSPSQFAYTGPTAPYQIASGASVTYQISFTPAAAQSYSGSLNVTSNTFSGSGAVPLSGTGVSATTGFNVSPSSLSFGNQAVNTTSAAQPVTVTNSGTTAITITAVSTAAPFVVTGFTGSATINPGVNLPLAVTFTPTTLTTSSGTLTISASSGGLPLPNQTVTLTGTGITQSSGVPICGKQNDGVNRIPADWATHVGPGKGGSYTDITYGCAIHQVTNAVIDSANNPESFHIYHSKMSVTNANDTFLMLVRQGGPVVVDMSGNWVVTDSTMHPFVNGSQSPPDWSPTDPNSFYYANGNSLMKGTITGLPSCISPTAGANGTACGLQITTVKTFTQYARVGRPDAADISMDGNHIYIAGWPCASGSCTFDMLITDLNGNITLPPFTTPSNDTPFGGPCAGDVSVQPGCVHGSFISPDNKLMIGFHPDQVVPYGGMQEWTGYTGTGVQAIIVQTGGSGYSSAPTVTVSGANCSGVSATANISGGAVTSVMVNAPGTCNDPAVTGPTVSFSGGGGSGASAWAEMAWVCLECQSTGGSHHAHGYWTDGVTPVFGWSCTGGTCGDPSTPTSFTNPCPSPDQYNDFVMINMVTWRPIGGNGGCLIHPIPPTEVSWQQNGATEPYLLFSFFDGRTPGPELFNNDPNYVSPVLTSQNCTQSATGWCIYEDEIMAIRVDAANTNSSMYRLAYAYSRSHAGSNFAAIPSASLSRDGKYVVFNSTMNFNQTGCGTVGGGTNCVDVFWIQILP